VDPSTVIFLLSLHLLASGGLLHLIARRLPPRSGLHAFAAGSALFGLSYGARLVFGLQGGPLPSVASDVVMVLCGLLFASGMRQFTGHDAWRWPLLAATTAAFALIDLALSAALGPRARLATVNIALGALFLTMAIVTFGELRRSERDLRVPMGVLGVLVGGQALLSAGRAVSLGLNGSPALYQGAFAQLFYAYTSLVALLFGPCLVWMVFVRLNLQLARLATHDALTQLFNRLGLDEIRRRHFGIRGHEPLHLLLVDIDHFKAINDRHGHTAGDSVLRAVAAALLGSARAGDFVARFGGEEFLVGCVGGGDAAALALAERLRAAVHALAVRPHSGGDETIRCTVSIGVSRQVEHADRWDAALAEADRALYAAKELGRNNVAAAPPVPATAHAVGPDTTTSAMKT